MGMFSEHPCNSLSSENTPLVFTILDQPSPLDRLIERPHYSTSGGLLNIYFYFERFIYSESSSTIHVKDIGSVAEFYQNRWREESRMQNLQTIVCISQLDYKHGVSSKIGNILILQAIKIILNIFQYFSLIIVYSFYNCISPIL